MDDETRRALEQAGPSGLELRPTAPADAEAARRFAERLTEQGREAISERRSRNDDEED